MILYDLFYRMDTDLIHDYFRHRDKPPFGHGVLCIPPKVNGPLKSFAWIGHDCEITRERVICPVCHTDEASKLRGKPIHGMVAFHCCDEGDVAEYFVPCFDLIVTEAFVDALKQTEFTGYGFFPLDAFVYGGVKQPKVFLLDCNGITHDEEERRQFERDHPYYCVNCHWGPRICPECLNFEIECPKCGQRKFKCDKQIPEEEKTPSRWVDIQYFDKIESHCSLPCEYWDGTDFLEGLYVTGRVAKWLVENQYGPVFLLPYPADISQCSDEQLERIKKVRYISC